MLFLSAFFVSQIRVLILCLKCNLFPGIPYLCLMDSLARFGFNCHSIVLFYFLLLIQGPVFSLNLLVFHIHYITYAVILRLSPFSVQACISFLLVLFQSTPDFAKDSVPEVC